MKKTYTTPTVEANEFVFMDVLTASDGVVDFNEDWLQQGGKVL